MRDPWMVSGSSDALHKKIITIVTKGPIAPHRFPLKKKANSPKLENPRSPIHKTPSVRLLFSRVGGMQSVPETSLSIFRLPLVKKKRPK